jgi:hypothetical protein
MQLTQPDIRPIKENRDLYELQQPYSFHLGLDLIIIPKGFRYDGASYANLLFQRDGIHRAACLVHDYLYVCRGQIGDVIYTRYEADKKFKSMLQEAGVKNWHAKLAYKAVRLLGWVYWND